MTTDPLRWCCQLVLAGLLLASVCASALAETRLEVNGVEGELKANFELLAGTPPPVDQTRQFRRYLADLPQLGVTALSALGYYAARVDLSTRTANGDTVITAQVTPNDPVLIEEIELTLEGPASEDPAYLRILDELPIAEGDVFVSGRYEATKATLLDQAQDLGYFDFRFTTSEVRVSRRQLTADIRLTASTGPRFTFGDILFQQDAFSRTFLQRWVPFEPGEPYEASLIGELTQNFQNSGYFQSVRVIPQQDRRYGTEVPIRVDLVTKDDNQVAIGIGYSTDIKARAKLTWGKPLINRRGHSADAQLGVSSDRQNISFAYRIPRSNQPLFNYWGIEYGVLNDTLGDTDSFLSTLNFQRVSRTSRQWIESLFVRWERERFTASGVEETTDLVLPGFSYQRSRSIGSPFPSRGQAISLQVMAGSRRILSTIDFFKAVTSLRYLRAVSDRNTLIGSVQYGFIQSNDYPRVPVSQRFFAGGDRSVRGYSYQDISPKNPAGEAVGGRYLEVVSLEYNYRFLDRWSAAVFSDAGRAFNSFTDSYRVGAGVGIRWQSPVGPFRIDIATPIDDDETSGFRIHLSLGPDL